MAVRLIWSPRSLNELQDVAAYIAADSPTYARLVVRRMVDRVALLPDMPGQGRRVPEYAGPLELREVFVHRWRLIYSVTGDGIEIITIIHGARRIENAL